MIAFLLATTVDLLPPRGLVLAAVAAVWLYEGLWCKLLRGDPRQFEIVAAVPRFGARFGVPFLLGLGVVEVLVGLWVLLPVAPILCATAQTVLLVALNTNGLLWSRHLIHDPAGMVVKNAALLVLAWVGASAEVTA
ncbi:MAG: DoxX-like family protein [Planctomycetota bacterium]